MKRFLALVVAGFLFLICGIAVFVWSGAYNVAANEPHWEITKWFLETVRERSISARSNSLTAPSSIDERAKENASYYYFATCQICHGAPDYPPHDFSKDMNPPPPNFVSGNAHEQEDTQWFWVIKNGIKMTGMAAFDQVLKENEIWALVHYLKRLHEQHEKK